jgi:prevent-host-death family protein
MSIQVNIGQAKTRLSELVAASLSGEDVVLSKAGKPVVRLIAIEDAAADLARREMQVRASAMRRVFGSLKDKFPPGAGDIFLEPDYTDEETDGFSANLPG